MLLDQTRGEPPTGGSDPQSLRSVCNRTSKNVWHVAQQKLQMTEGVVIRDVCRVSVVACQALKLISSTVTTSLRRRRGSQWRSSPAMILQRHSQTVELCVCCSDTQSVRCCIFLSASTFPLHIAPSCVDAPGSSFRGNTGKLALQRVNFLRFL